MNLTSQTMCLACGPSFGAMVMVLLAVSFYLVGVVLTIVNLGLLLACKMEGERRLQHLCHFLVYLGAGIMTLILAKGPGYQAGLVITYLAAPLLAIRHAIVLVYERRS